VRLASAHRLGEIKRAGIRSTGQPLKACIEKPVKPFGEMVPAKEFPWVQTRWIVQVLHIGDLIDQVIALNEVADLTGLTYGLR
jgi:hypothetical protein